MKGFPAGGIRLNGVIFGRASQDEVETAKEALRSWPKIDRVTLHYFEVWCFCKLGMSFVSTTIWHDFWEVVGWFWDVLIFIFSYQPFGLRLLGSLMQATFIDMISHIVSMSIFQHVVSHGLQLGHKFPYYDVQHILLNHSVIINFVARLCGALFHSPIVFMRFHASNVAVIWYLGVASLEHLQVHNPTQ